MRLVAEGLRGAIFLENPAADATRLNSSRTRPSCKVPPQPFALSRRDGNTDAFNNQICLPLLTVRLAERRDGNYEVQCSAITVSTEASERARLLGGTKGLM
jgi:hypothetical protein